MTSTDHLSRALDKLVIECVDGQVERDMLRIKKCFASAFAPIAFEAANLLREHIRRYASTSLPTYLRDKSLSFIVRFQPHEVLGFASHIEVHWGIFAKMIEFDICTEALVQFSSFETGPRQLFVDLAELIAGFVAERYENV